MFFKGVRFTWAWRVATAAHARKSQQPEISVDIARNITPQAEVFSELFSGGNTPAPPESPQLSPRFGNEAEESKAAALASALDGFMRDRKVNAENIDKFFDLQLQVIRGEAEEER